LSAATLAGLIRLSRREDIADEPVVLVITGGRVD
jgi:threonine synthase